jgi:hypothetical protein
MLTTDDVIDLMGQGSIVFVDETILTSTTSPLSDL